MSATMRIHGLVRFYNQTRARLRDGIAGEDREEFRDSVERVVWRVEEMCGEDPRGPEGLPAPSRKAYRFLKELDLTELPEPRPGTPSSSPAVRVSGAVSAGRYFASRLWRECCELGEDPGARRRLRDEIRGHTSAIEDLCGEQGGAPSSLAIQSRRVYTWMKFLLLEGNFSLHLEALCRAHGAARRAGEGDVVVGVVHLVNTAPLYRVRHYEGAAILTCQEAYLTAPSEVWDALISVGAGGKRPEEKRLVREFATTDAFASILCEMEALAWPEGSARGVHHDLDASFDRVNDVCFGGGMARPKLVWNTIPTTRKYGHYQPSTDTVVLSVSLDAPKVPAFVVDFVLYHELLHKRHGIRWVNGRRIAHDPAFRAEERRHPRFAEAKRVLGGGAIH